MMKLATSIVDGSGSGVDTTAAWVVCNLAALQSDAIQAEWFIPPTATALEKMLQSPQAAVRRRALCAMATVGRNVCSYGFQASTKRAFAPEAVAALLPLVWGLFESGDAPARQLSLAALTHMMHQGTLLP